MTKKNTRQQVQLELENEDTVVGEDTVLSMLTQQAIPSLTPDESLRLELINLTKDILINRAAMAWETHKKHEPLDVDTVISETKKMFKFVRGEE